MTTILSNQKKIKIDVANNFVYIDNCEITIFLNVKTSRKIVHTSIHARKTTIVSSRFEMTIIVHYTTISKNRDFLFESKTLNLFFYVYLVNINCKSILVRNDNNKTIQISRNYRVNRMIEIDFSNVFQISTKNNVVDLILRKFFTKYKTNWFKKIIVVVYVVIAMLVDKKFSQIVSTIIISTLIISQTISSIVIINETFSQTILFVFSNLNFLVEILSQSIYFVVSNKILKNVSIALSFEIILNNEIIIHRFNDVVVQIFKNLINEYSNFWKKIDFAKLSKENWINFFLKFDWENRISNKTKMYSLNTKNKKLIDETFDKFHESKKLNWIESFISFRYSIFCVWKMINNNKKTSDNWYTWFKYNHSIERLFFVVSNENYFCRNKMSIHYRHRLFRIFLSIKNSFKKSL